MVPAEGGPNILKLKSSWHRRRRSKILAVSLKGSKGREVRGVRGGTPPPPTVYGRSNASLPCPPNEGFCCQPRGSKAQEHLFLDSR